MRRLIFASLLSTTLYADPGDSKDTIIAELQNLTRYNFSKCYTKVAPNTSSDPEIEKTMVREMLTCLAVLNYNEAISVDIRFWQGRKYVFPPQTAAEIEAVVERELSKSRSGVSAPPPGAPDNRTDVYVPAYRAASAIIEKMLDREAKQKKTNYAETERRRMIPVALEKLDALLKKRPENATGDSGSIAQALFTEEEQKTIKALDKWLLAKQLDEHFWTTARKARELIAKNQALTGKVPFFLDDERADDYASCPGASNLDPALGIYFQKPFFDTNNDCRREVLLHEYFHLVVGPGHFYSAKDTSEALRCPHHLSELIAQLYIGVDHTPGCERPIVR